MQESSILVSLSNLLVVLSTDPKTQSVSGSPIIYLDPSILCVAQLSSPSNAFNSTNNGLPINPLSTNSLAFSHPGVNLLWWEITSFTLFSLHASSIDCAGPEPIDIGFSHIIAFTPAFAASIVCSWCNACQVHILTISGIKS